MEDLDGVLAGNPYPGRGLVCTGTSSGALLGYFVTGRSPASRQREIRRGPGGDLVVAPLGEGADDPLRHYAAATQSDEWLVCGNGRQVTEVSERLAAGMAPAVALDDLEHEPDAPIFTDRITAVVTRRGPAVVVMSAARRSAGGRTASDILTATVRQPADGDGVLLATYRSDGTTIEKGEFCREVACRAGDADGLLEMLWGALDPRFRVAVAVVDPARGLDQAIVRNH
jgi:IMP cyclohydrolase